MTTSSPQPRPTFDPVDTTFNPTVNAQRDDVESPSLSSSNALARFEFEPGRSKEGTKVLMVEWEDDATTAGIGGEWAISWEGKRTVLPARDQTRAQEIPINRLYFLLGPGVAIPPTVTLRKGHVTWRTNPLPAIFAPGLGATARQAGKKGVLHTIWAKKRLQVLQAEIDVESKDNVEGVGLQMATAEKEWIEANFGVAGRPGSISIAAQGSLTAASNLNSPTSPRSPGGGRLMDKLKGLKLGTSAQDLSSRSSSRDNEPAPELRSSFQQHQQQQPNPLSPEGSDVAIGSFGSFAALKGMPPTSTLAAKPAQQPAPPTQQKKIAVQRPPEQQQQRSGSEVGSLNAFANNGGFYPPERGSPGQQQDDGDDLFALPMSPRSPEMSKSPFSFGTQDTGQYLKGGQA